MVAVVGLPPPPAAGTSERHVLAASVFLLRTLSARDEFQQSHRLPADLFDESPNQGNSCSSGNPSLTGHLKLQHSSRPLCEQSLGYIRICELVSGKTMPTEGLSVNLSAGIG